jgi:hypothetical protein
MKNLNTKRHNISVRKSNHGFVEIDGGSDKDNKAADESDDNITNACTILLLSTPFAE